MALFAKIGINTVSVEELITIEGIGEKKVKTNVKYRKINGKFESIDNLQNIKGIGSNITSNIKNDVKNSSKAKKTLTKKTQKR